MSNESSENEELFYLKMQEDFHDIDPILKHLYFPNKGKYLSQCPLVSFLPHFQYNNQSSALYLHEPTHQSSKSLRSTSSFCVSSHPLLPLYLSSSDKGILTAWSYHYSKKKPLYDFFINKSAKEGNVKSKISKIEFNDYGSQFLSVDKENCASYLFEFDYTNIRSIANYTFGGNSSKRMIKDACLVNSSGVIAATYVDSDNNRYTNLYDSLLFSSGNGNVSQELYGTGGNLITMFNYGNSFIIGNNTNGYINFIDIRQMKSYNSFKVHDDEVKSIVLSNNQNYMATSGAEGSVKIWDISRKSDITLVETINPFLKEKNYKKINLIVKNECLYAGGSSSIKLLRNKF